ncbi:MAG: ABC transporter substrate-binding protein [Anaerolineales bacterium]
MPQRDPHDDSQLDEALRRAMHARWDAEPTPEAVSKNLRTQARAAQLRGQVVSAAGVLGSVALVALIGFTFNAILSRQAAQPIPATAVTEVEVTRIAEVFVTEVVTIAVTPEPFTAPHPILSDVRVRRAIAHCTDRAGLLRAAYPWVTDTASFEADSFIPREHWAYAPDIARYPFDPAQGAALLEEAGWTLTEGADDRVNASGDELALMLTTTDAQFRRMWAEVWEEQMKACGIRIVRFHTPGAWLFGASTGLRRRDFEIAAFAWVAEDDPGGRDLYSCDSIPSPANNWQGQNYAGWCNETADTAIRTATAALDRETRRAAYAAVQIAMADDVPNLPLFFRPAFFAVNAALENFQVDGTEVYPTWNAAQWRIPGHDTIVIGEDGEPATLATPEIAYVAQELRRLITGVDYTHFSYDYQPVMLTKMPTLASGAAVSAEIVVVDGSSVVDVGGEAVELTPGVRVRDAGSNEVEFTGDPLVLRQLTVTYEFVNGLTWSDGTPVTQADYEFAYRIECDPQTGVAQFWNTNLRCAQIARVEFLSDRAYAVTYMPGYDDSQYVLPPFSRLPAHQIIGDGRRLVDVSPTEWGTLREVNAYPLGVGPYRMVKWEFGKEMVLEANPHYFAGPPATPNIIVKFLEHEAVIDALLASEVDVLDAETLLSNDLLDFSLMQAQTDGKIRLITPPSQTWEHLDFALFLR